MRKFLLVCLVILTASCAVRSSALPTPATSTAVTALKDGGIISQKPCGPPCFYGIIPGTTTEADVERVLQNLGDVFIGCQAFDYTSRGAGRGLACAHRVGLGYDRQVVEGVNFSPWEDVTVQEVIEKYGFPDQVNVFFVSLPDSPFRVGAGLSYDRLQTFLGLPDQDGRKYVISPNTKITQIAYYAEGKYKDLRGATSSAASNWQGFGTYIPTP